MLKGEVNIMRVWGDVIRNMHDDLNILRVENERLRAALSAIIAEDHDREDTVDIARTALRIDRLKSEPQPGDSPIASTSVV